jgi:hypothetical protein
MRSVDAARQPFGVAIFVDFPTSTTSSSTSIRDGVERCVGIATSMSCDVAAYEAGVEEWAMDVEDTPSDVAEISSRAVAGSLAVGA